MADDINIPVRTTGTQRAARNLRDVGDEAEDVAGRFGVAGGAISSAVKLAGVAIVANLGADAAVAIAKTGIELELLASRVDTVFGDSSAQVDAWAETVSVAMGTSSQRVSGLAAEVGDLLIPLGASSEEAAALSQSAVQLASDLDLWSTQTDTVAEATKILTSGILGEREGLKQLGIQIDQAMIEARLLELGLGDLDGQARNLAEAQITLQLAMEQSASAIEFAGSESAETQLKVREMQARWTQLKDDLSTALLPTLVRLGEGLLAVVGWIERDVVPAVVGFARWVRNAARTVADFVQAIGGFGTAVGRNIAAPFVFAAEKVQLLINKIQALINKIPSIPSLPSLGGFDFTPGFDIPGIPGFASGAVVSAAAGGTAAIVAEAGEDEAIMPVSRLNGLFSGGVGSAGGVVVGTINVEVGPGGDPSAVGAAIVEALDAYTRRNGAGWVPAAAA